MIINKNLNKKIFFIWVCSVLLINTTSAFYINSDLEFIINKFWEECDGSVQHSFSQEEFSFEDFRKIVVDLDLQPIITSSNGPNLYDAFFLHSFSCKNKEVSNKSMFRDARTGEFFYYDEESLLDNGKLSPDVKIYRINFPPRKINNYNWFLNNYITFENVIFNLSLISITLIVYDLSIRLFKKRKKQTEEEISKK